MKFTLVLRSIATIIVATIAVTACAGSTDSTETALVPADQVERPAVVTDDVVESATAGAALSTAAATVEFDAAIAAGIASAEAGIALAAVPADVVVEEAPVEVTAPAAAPGAAPAAVPSAPRPGPAAAPAPAPAPAPVVAPAPAPAPAPTTTTTAPPAPPTAVSTSGRSCTVTNPGAAAGDISATYSMTIHMSDGSTHHVSGTRTGQGSHSLSGAHPAYGRIPGSPTLAIFAPNGCAI